MKIRVVFLILMLSLNLCSEEKLVIRGSSTLYLFSSTVSSIVGAMNGKYHAYVISSGSTDGIKNLCSDEYKGIAYIANASRRIKQKELNTCREKGVNDIVELYIGRNGIVFAQNNNSNPISLSREEIFLALAKEVPDINGKLQPNPYKMWSDINPKLPKRKILVYGHSETSGIRESFNAIIIKHISRKSKNIAPMYKKAGFKSYIELRQDGAFIELADDEEVHQKLKQDKDAIGNLNYLYYDKNRDKISGIDIDGKRPNKENIHNASYKLAKKLYMYYRKNIKYTSKPFKSYVSSFLSENTIGDDGILKEIGFVPLSQKKREQVRNVYEQDICLKEDDLL